MKNNKDEQDKANKIIDSYLSKILGGFFHSTPNENGEEGCTSKKKR